MGYRHADGDYNQDEAVHALSQEHGESGMTAWQARHLTLKDKWDFDSWGVDKEGLSGLSEEGE